jgi:hypothetical protein
MASLQQKKEMDTNRLEIRMKALAALVHRAHLNDKSLHETQLYILELQNLVNIREAEIELLKEMLERRENGLI